MSAIFRNVSQALHFAFVIEQYPPAGASNVRTVIGILKKEMGIRLDEADTTTMRLEGLSPLEVRAQCADIRAQVRRQLDELHAQALEARFSEERDVKRFAIRCLAAHAAAQLVVSVDCALALCWRHYMPADRRDRDFTFRQIAEQYGISKDKAARAAGKLALILAELEADGMEQLAHDFEIAGVVEPLPAMAA